MSFQRGMRHASKLAELDVTNQVIVAININASSTMYPGVEGDEVTCCPIALECIQHIPNGYNPLTIHTCVS